MDNVWIYCTAEIDGHSVSNSHVFQSIKNTEFIIVGSCWTREII